MAAIPYSRGSTIDGGRTGVPNGVGGAGSPSPMTARVAVHGNHKIGGGSAAPTPTTPTRRTVAPAASPAGRKSSVKASGSVAMNGSHTTYNGAAAARTPSNGTIGARF